RPAWAVPGDGASPAAGASDPPAWPGQPGAGRGYGTGPAVRRAPAGPETVPLRPLGVAEILDGAFVTMRTNPAAALGLSAIAGMVIWLVTALAAVAAEDAPWEYYLLIQLATAGAWTVLVVLMSGVLAVVVAESTLGRRIGVVAAARRIAPRLPGLFVISLVVTALIAVGLALGGIGVFWLGLLFCYAAPAYALEGGTIGEALRRGHFLIGGTWWRTIGIMSLAIVVAATFMLVVAVPIGLLAVPEGSLANQGGDRSATDYVIQALAGLTLTTLTTPVLSGALAVLYIDRRIRREGLDLALRLASSGGRR
ncbi:MAG: hypothetical protein IRZ08_20140, partial [Frankia sp.]|nr:hypothetical protein [Frankia sp.]